MVFIASGRLTRAQAGQDSQPAHAPAPGQAEGGVTPDSAVTSAEGEVTDAVDSDAEPGAMTVTLPSWLQK